LEDVDVLLADQETQLAKLKKERDVLREQVEALK
jgi:cell division protein FtsB